MKQHIGTIHRIRNKLLNKINVTKALANIVHEGEKPISCPALTKKFIKKVFWMKQHIWTIHGIRNKLLNGINVTEHLLTQFMMVKSQFLALPGQKSSSQKIFWIKQHIGTIHGIRNKLLNGINVMKVLANTFHDGEKPISCPYQTKKLI